MKITKIVFSPTGGTMRIVESLFDGQLYEDREINLITKDIDFSSVKIEHDELVVIAMPSYSGRAPEHHVFLWYHMETEIMKIRCWKCQTLQKHADLYLLQQFRG